MNHNFVLLSSGFSDGASPIHSHRYNFIAKKLYKRLSQLGARPFHSIILADDQHELGADAALDVNIPDLWSNVLDISPLPANRSIIPATEL